MIPTRLCTLALLAAACAPCSAQSPVTFMPEGSRDVQVALMWGAMPATEGSRKIERYLLPYFGVRWSNGIFVDGFSVGAQLSRTPGLRFGPLVGLADDEPREPGEPVGRRLVAAGFADYQLLHNVGLHATARYGAGRGGGGADLKLRVRTSVPLAPHHGAVIELGASVADRSYMRSHFGATAGAGLKNVFGGASWSWQMSRKYTLRSGLSLTRLGDNAGASRFVETRYGAHLWTGVLYRF